MPNRTVFFVSDGTGITAETFGNSILAQFAVKPRHVRRPFIDTADKAHQVVREINHTAEREGQRPIVFITLVNAEMLAIVTAQSQGPGAGHVPHLHRAAGGRVRRQVEPPRRPLLRRLARARSTPTASRRSTSRWPTTTASRRKNLDEADVILVGVSRSGKTPTSLYLAMQHGIKAANYPLIPEDFERGKLPVARWRRTRPSASA